MSNQLISVLNDSLIEIYDVVMDNDGEFEDFEERVGMDDSVQECVDNLNEVMDTFEVQKKVNDMMYNIYYS